MSRNIKLLIGALMISTLAFARGYLPQSQTIDFTRDIQPIFAAHCVSCHGAKKAAGQLRLDNKTAAMKGGISGANIIPGNSKAVRQRKAIQPDSIHSKFLSLLFISIRHSVWIPRWTFGIGLPLFARLLVPIKVRAATSTEAESPW